MSKFRTNGDLLRYVVYECETLDYFPHPHKPLTNPVIPLPASPADFLGDMPAFSSKLVGNLMWFKAKSKKSGLHGTGLEREIDIKIQLYKIRCYYSYYGDILEFWWEHSDVRLS